MKPVTRGAGACGCDAALKFAQCCSKSSKVVAGCHK